MEVSLAKREDESSYPPGYFHPHYDLPPASEATINLHQHLNVHHDRLQAPPTLHAKSDDHRQAIYSSDYARSLGIGSRHLLGSLHQSYDAFGTLSRKFDGALRHGKYGSGQTSRESSYASPDRHNQSIPNCPLGLGIGRFPKDEQSSYANHSYANSQLLADRNSTVNRTSLFDVHDRANSQYPDDTCNPSSTSCSHNVTSNSSPDSSHGSLAFQNPFTNSHNLLISHIQSKQTTASSPVLSRSLSPSNSTHGQSSHPHWTSQKPSSESGVGRSLVPGRHRVNGTEQHSSSTTVRALETHPKYSEQFHSDHRDVSEIKPSSSPAKFERRGQLRTQSQDVMCEDAMLKPAKLGQEGQIRLHYQDFVEIKNLKETYHVTFDVSSLPLGERMIKTDEMSKLYSCFVQRRAKFFVNTPLYKTLAPSDRPKLLHMAVAMSAYFTGAHLIDTKDYTWSERLGVMEKPLTPIMSASTIRHFLTHEQFVYLMRFYTTYSPVFSDQTIAILMQMLSLFYPQPGLREPEVVEQGRLHYGSLLSRYLLAVHGPEEGPERLRMLIVSQQEARYLVELLQHVELTPTIPREDLVVNSKKLLLEGLQMVCQEARENRSRVVREKKERRFPTDSSGSYGGSHPFPRLSVAEDPHTVPRSPPSSSTPPIQDSERLDFIGKTFSNLANCDDPKILAEARQILPVDLIRRIFQHL